MEGSWSLFHGPDKNLGNAAPKAIHPAATTQRLSGGYSPPLSSHSRREHMAAYLCSCCSYGLSGLMVLGGSGGFAWGEGEEGACKGWAAPAGGGAVPELSLPSSMVCHPVTELL